jgi:RNA polymerase sigma factor (sigma-70 family)
LSKAAHNYHAFTDIELIAHYRESRDNYPVGILFERYSTMVCAVCMKYLKDEEESRDAAMQVFEKLLTDLLKHDIANFRSWLHSVARNYCLMQLRSKPKMTLIKGDVAENVAPVMEFHHALHQEEKQVLEEQLNGLEKCIQALNAAQRTCVELFFQQEKSYQEITGLTGYSLNDVKSYLQNGKRNLKICLSKQDELGETA